jgi:hypothetical protein
MIPPKLDSKNLRSVYILSFFGRSSTINACVFNLVIPANEIVNAIAVEI